MKLAIKVLCISFLSLWLLPKFAVVRIEPWEIGVRRSLTGGIAEEDFGLGYHLRIPLQHSYYRLPRAVQYLHYNNDKGTRGSLELRTKENNIIFVDVTIPWRIIDGEAWQIVQSGILDSYRVKVQSTATGVLREGLAALSNAHVQQPDERQKVAAAVLPALNAQLAQYHVKADKVVLRALRFRPEYEKKLQNKQYFVVQGRLDDAFRLESIAVQETDTFEKTILKDVNLKRESWNEKIEMLKTEFELQIATIDAQALEYDRQRRATADAFVAEATATGDLAEAKAEALGQRLKAKALATRAGRTYSAITAAENFELGDITLNSNDPEFLLRFGGMKAWRRFFLGQ
jgi:regulator of protease activity HflC (stomatin/prohibitin superfamily)